MNWADIYHVSGGTRRPERRTVQLQGPRPSPLSLNKDSRKIGKPPRAPPPFRLPKAPPRAPPAESREPVIIYSVSPKVIHAEPSDFRSVVQRLTGLCSSSFSAKEFSAGGPVSPAARLAAIERASPTGRGKSVVIDELEILDMVGWETGDVDLGQTPGILSPEPANLQEVTTGMFSSEGESQTLFGFQDNLMSPLVYGNLFMGSPSSSALISGGSMFSPTLSPVFDISTLFHP